MPHRVHQSGQMSEVVLENLRLITRLAQLALPLPIPVISVSSPTCAHRGVLPIYLAGVELQPSQEAFDGLDLLRERYIRRGQNPLPSP